MSKNKFLAMLTLVSLLAVPIFASQTAYAATSINLTLMPSISVNVTDLNLELLPTSTLTTGQSQITTASNNITGYTTLISMDGNLEETNVSALKNETAGTIIPALTEQTESANFPVNHWGVSFDNNTFFSLSARDGELTEIPSLSPENAGEHTQNLSVGAKIDNHTIAGTYTNKLLVTVIPNYIPVPSCGDYRKMQDIETIMETMTEGEQIQLCDERDYKIYWVAKLADGNVWMTQNLDYDIIDGDNIVSNLDGTTSIWNASSTYAPQATLTGTAFTSHFKSSDGNTSTYSYDPGNYYWNGTTWLGINNNNNTQGYSASGLSTAFSTTAPADGGTHYHVGNLYQYNAATAGTGGTITEKDATSSICPKGWRLPTSNSTTANYSFGKLKNAYYTTTGTALAASPLRFVPAGYLYSGKLYNAGYNGAYRSSMSYSSSSDAYNLYFDSSNIDPSGSSYRYNGYPVRCVAMRKVGIEKISTMQEMNSAYCDETPEHFSKQLMDERDGKLYWVTKLSDGNCWMTQNLDYDIKGDGTDIFSDGENETTYVSEWYYQTETLSPTNTVDSVVSGVNSYSPASNIACTTTSNDGEECHNHPGNDYGVIAAMAGINPNSVPSTMHNPMGTGEESLFISVFDVPYSICPGGGWTMPTSEAITYRLDTPYPEARDYILDMLGHPEYGPFFESILTYIDRDYTYLNDSGYWSSFTAWSSPTAFTSMEESYINYDYQEYGSYKIRCVYNPKHINYYD